MTNREETVDARTKEDKVIVSRRVNGAEGCVCKIDRESAGKGANHKLSSWHHLIRTQGVVRVSRNGPEKVKDKMIKLGPIYMSSAWWPPKHA